jgi:hypothetical protein
VTEITQDAMPRARCFALSPEGCDIYFQNTTIPQICTGTHVRRSGPVIHVLRTMCSTPKVTEVPGDAMHRASCLALSPEGYDKNIPKYNNSIHAQVHV